MSTTIQKLVLINARTLIADPQHWTWGTLARSREGQEVSWADRFAHRWCAMGAIYRAAFDLLGDANKAANVGNDVVRSIIPPGVSQLRGYLATLNDRKGHAAVIAAFDRALAVDRGP
jgi:hypothetical protein